jgi:glyoxylase-like metal-dependent hydrolase (beta-lactamase superfamily II)
MVWLRRLGILIAVLVVLAVPAYWWFLMESHMPSTGSYTIDMAEVRRLADSMPGDKPSEVRVETIAQLLFPSTAVVAGDSWDSTDMPVSAYQVVYADHTVMVDTAFGPGEIKGFGSSLKSFDNDAYARLSTALHQASLIVVTHEHMDHTGGFFAQPDADKLMPALKLNKEQFDNPQFMQPVVFPEALRKGYEPLSYDRYLAIAPGIVLIKAPGHTPGSQIVYIKRADGAEMLLLGDVAWHERNVDIVRERARLVTQFMLREDRDAVMLELGELNRLHAAEPKLAMMPGHDAGSLAQFTGSGLMVVGFK